VAEDFFPERPLTIRQISFTYSIMNLVNPWFGGIPNLSRFGRDGGALHVWGRAPAVR